MEELHVHIFIEQSMAIIGSEPGATKRVSIGDCNVDIPQSLAYEHTADAISVKIPYNGFIKISQKSETNGVNVFNNLQKGSKDSAFHSDLSIQLVNPNSVASEVKSLLKDVLNLYNVELPEMKFAVNTRKDSKSIESCVMSGKYSTLLVKRASIDRNELVAAVSYQILCSTTLSAEIPLAVVSKNYQNKGIGSLMFHELQRRLQDVGVQTIYCWSNNATEMFWIKQGFEKIREVDESGKPCKSPLKADIRRAMTISTSAKLLVFRIHNKPALPLYSECKFSTMPVKEIQLYTECKFITSPLKEIRCYRAEGLIPAHLLAKTVSPAEMLVPASDDHKSSPRQAKSLPDSCLEPVVNASSIVPSNIDVTSLSAATGNESTRFCDVERSQSQLSFSQASCSKLNTLTDVQGQCGQITIPNDKTNLEMITSDLKIQTPTNKGTKRVCVVHESERSQKEQKLEELTKEFQEDHSEFMVSITCLRSPHKQSPKCYSLKEMNVSASSTVKIMLMNMADSNKRSQITKFIERLGGTVTDNGSESTHVITGEVRRTLNFCSALNAGAWIVSSAWLKASVKHNKFVDESSYVLVDPAFEAKYKTTLANVIQKAKQRANGLLDGISIYATKNVQPPLHMLSKVIVSAGGKVLSNLEEAKDCMGAIVVACEDDISEALTASKSGIPTYSNEWLMSCIMKQEVDMTTTQFAESL